MFCENVVWMQKTKLILKLVVEAENELIKIGQAKQNLKQAKQKLQMIRTRIKIIRTKAKCNSETQQQNSS